LLLAIEVVQKTKILGFLSPVVVCEKKGSFRGWQQTTNDVSCSYSKHGVVACWVCKGTDEGEERTHFCFVCVGTWSIYSYMQGELSTSNYCISGINFKTLELKTENKTQL